MSRDGLPGWIRLVRTGTLFEAFRSATARTGSKIGSDSVIIGDTVYVGIAVASVADSTPPHVSGCHGQRASTV